MDINEVIMVGLGLAGFWFGVIKFVSGKLMGLDQKISESHKELDAKIDDVKEKYVRHEYLDIHIDKITETQREIKDSIEKQSKESKSLYNKILELVDRRRDPRD